MSFRQYLLISLAMSEDMDAAFMWHFSSFEDLHSLHTECFDVISFYTERQLVVYYADMNTNKTVEFMVHLFAEGRDQHHKLREIQESNHVELCTRDVDFHHAGWIC